MPSTAYLAPAKPISLHTILDPSLARGPTPHIELEWEPFQFHVEAFLNAIDTYALSAKTEIAARATDHIAIVRDLTAEKDETERRIQQEKEREGVMLATLDTERLTLNDLTSSLSRLQQNLAKVKEQSAAIEAELSAARNHVKGERAEKDRQARVLNDMREKDDPALMELEAAMGWRVQGVKEDLLLNRFTLIDPTDQEREFSFVIDISKQEYSVPNCSPPIATMAEYVRQLNTDRQFFAFIKKVRKSFQALVPRPPKDASAFEGLTGLGHRGPSSTLTPDNAVLDGSPGGAAGGSVTADQVAAA